MRVLKDMREKGLTRINAKSVAEQQWRKDVFALSEATLRHNVDGWYNGQNIPGKPREPLNWGGGLPLYLRTLDKVFAQGYDGFEVQ